METNMSDAIGRDGGSASALAAADWLSLAATPTFAVMALLTAGFGGGAMEKFCSAGPFPLGGMVIMYGLMSLFHSPPWLRLIARRRGAARPI
jgi:hypothetical protein